MAKPRVLISACLCGQACRYDGRTAAREDCVRLAKAGIALPVCPELLGGLPVPRAPCEISGGRVLTAVGLDCTAAFEKGAQAALALARKHGIRQAVLKERSPSCGTSLVYDGSFAGNLVPGQGMCTALFRRSGVQVYAEESVEADAIIRQLSS
ncbi:DUF523 domain-containing protein [Desulfovibrio sp. OttesenSCG-928-G15]|nr:DUF523 domain-containing protein [Desulfovibrio sp. OttesenSCG-928-G15]